MHRISRLSGFGRASAVADKNTRFETFRDGLVELYELDNQSVPVQKFRDIRFQNRMVGAKRNYEAQQAGVTIRKLIRVPIRDPEMISSGMFAVIRGRQYKIETAQVVPDTVPRSMDLTLVQPDLLLSFDRKEAGSGGRL